MFFIGIFGIDEREKEIKTVQNIVCKSCGSMTTYKLFKVNKVVHFFFIPILRWDKRYYLVSRCCNSIFTISEELGKALENNENIDIKNEDLEEINIGVNMKQRICKNCRNIVQANFIYCPYCGEKIE